MKSEQTTVFTTRGLVFGLVLGASAVLAAPAMAQEEPAGPFSLTGNVTFASQYVFRGVSLSNEKPAIQGGLTLSHESGFYASAWGSSGKFNDGAGSVEFDYIAGYATEVSGIKLDASVTYYTYPGDGRKGDYFEFIGKAGYDFGLAALTAGVGYVPSGQEAYADGDAVYLFSDLQVPVPNTPVTGVFHIGYEDFGHGVNKLDWSAGLAVKLYGLDLSVAYIDTDLKGTDLADSRVLFTVGKSF